MKQRKLHRTRKAVQLIMLILIFSFSLQANDENKTVIVAYTEWFPYTYLEDGQAAGFEIDITRAVLKQMNIAATFQQYPWNRCLQLLKLGEVAPHSKISK